MDIYFEQHKPSSSIANFLQNGCKPSSVKTLGFELEHFVVHKNTHAPVPFLAANGSDAPSVEKLLEALKPYYPQTTIEVGSDGKEHLFGLGRDKAVLTLEPGAQLEISIGPASSVGEIEALYQQFRTEIDPLLTSWGLELVELGYHPQACAATLELLPKSRYALMNHHFAHTGKHGICMMRATASTQVSVDFFSEADALLKMRVANALGPLFAFITDDTPVFEGERVGFCGGGAAQAASGLAVPYRLARSACWDDTDPARCLIARDAFDDDFSFARYAEILINSPALFVPSQQGAAPDYLGTTTFKQALANEFIDEALVQHILSLSFFDTRLKSYLEIRQADSLPLPWALAYTALISGIFYHPAALEYYAQRFTYCDIAAVAFAKTALRARGYEAVVYGRPAAEWLDELIGFAASGLSAADLPYLNPLATLIGERRTLLDAPALDTPVYDGSHV